ncbi:hypothetical protein PIIN_05380 [Serendipita indica DSM 11827]|uniref:Coiled-coil domain-containing protein 16 n=1 Tax=Serendipita indica (strain DSM 11827) TaxID=1109443 RepID=G4TJF4_SERID|nr:hypothetical protein PIIN_05380 [Serendipita indica DSM 11827]
MSTDVRALLKAKAQERSKRITHPFAAYNASGQLRCTLCAIVVKDNETAWAGHLGSKSHRTNAGRLKEAQERESEKMRLEKGKRKALVAHDDDEPEDEEDEVQNGHLDAKAHGSKRQKTEEEQRPSSEFAASNFFSDPKRTLPTRDSDDEGDDGGEPASTPAAKTTQPSQLDMEWAQFEREVLARPTASEQVMSRKDIYDRATVAAEEVITSTADDGFPSHLRQGNGANTQAIPSVGPSGGRVGAVIDGEVITELPPEDETPEQARERKEREERELIMDRIMEEERAQEDADERVRSLKARLALVKQKREAERKRKLGTT